MGTRHLIEVVVDGQIKVAQYGQWDGYPSGQGVDVLKFLAENDLEAFKAKASQCSWLTQADVVMVNATANWTTIFPWLSRDAGSDILTHVMGSENGLKLQNSHEFASESLFCEYAYVIDFDKNSLEVYKGFNKDELATGERFADLIPEDKEYQPVKLVALYSLSDLPSRDEFLAELEPADEED